MPPPCSGPSASTEFETLPADIFGDPPKDDPRRQAPAPCRPCCRLFTVANGASRMRPCAFTCWAWRRMRHASASAFFSCVTLGELGQRIAQHFEDCGFRAWPARRAVPQFERLLQTVCLRYQIKQPFGDMDRLPPNLGGAIVDAIFAGQTLPYPAMWLNAAVGRCREQAKEKPNKARRHRTSIYQGGSPSKPASIDRYASQPFCATALT